MKYSQILLVTLLLVSCSSPTADVPPLGEGADEISRFLEGVVESGRIPGVVALVTDRDGILYHEAFGWQNVAAGFDMDPDTIFRLYSLTKPITSVAVMMLVEDELIDLDDPASDYLPELAAIEVMDEVDLDAGIFGSRPAEETLTVRHLLSHTSGLGYPWSSPALFRFLAPNQNPVELPLLHEPGAAWTYGESTRVLGEIVEAVSGELLETFFRNRIFRPLGMDDTGYVVREDSYHRFVTTHRREDGLLIEEPNPAPPVYFEIRGDSRLTSTASDYASFLQMLLNEGAADTTRLLEADTVALMRQNQIGELRVQVQPIADPAVGRPFPLGAGRDTFGLGFQITEPGGGANTRSPGSYSWSGLQNTHFWVDPVEGIAALVFMQVLPFYDDAAIEVLQGFEQRVYQSLESR